MFLLILLLMLGCWQNSVAVSVCSCIYSTCCKCQYTAVLYMVINCSIFLHVADMTSVLHLLVYHVELWTLWMTTCYSVSFSLKRIYQLTDQIFNLVNMIFPFLLNLVFRIHMATWDALIFDENIIIVYRFLTSTHTIQIKVCKTTQL
jgi:hypothetical protein